MNYEIEYNRIMGLLRATRMQHGKCQPREHRACTHCNAVDDIERLVNEWGGPRISLSGAALNTGAGE